MKSGLEERRGRLGERVAGGWETACFKAKRNQKPDIQSIKRLGKCLLSKQCHFPRKPEPGTSHRYTLHIPSPMSPRSEGGGRPGNTATSKQVEYNKPCPPHPPGSEGEADLEVVTCGGCLGLVAFHFRCATESTRDTQLVQQLLIRCTLASYGQHKAVHI